MIAKSERRAAARNARSGRGPVVEQVEQVHGEPRVMGVNREVDQGNVFVPRAPELKRGIAEPAATTVSSSRRRAVAASTREVAGACSSSTSTRASTAATR